MPRQKEEPTRGARRGFRSPGMDRGHAVIWALTPRGACYVQATTVVSVQTSNYTVSWGTDDWDACGERCILLSGLSGPAQRTLPVRVHSLRQRQRAGLAGGFVLALMLAGASPAQAADMATTATCVDGGGISWRTKVVWGKPYVASDGVRRVHVDYAGWTTRARVLATDSIVRSYDGSGALVQKLVRTASRDYHLGSAYDSRNPVNPPSRAAKVTISVGKDDDGFANCIATHRQPVAAAVTTLTAYVTGYTYYDNTPPGSATISHPVIHTRAGGVGTYDDPVTVAVGHSMATGRDVLDYPAGTRFYMPYLKRYFIVEDTCGDGARPEQGPCHVHPANVTAWLDIWVDGRGGSENSATACAEAITGNQLVITNPGPDHPVLPGPVSSNGQCAI